MRNSIICLRCTDRSRHVFEKPEFVGYLDGVEFSVIARRQSGRRTRPLPQDSNGCIFRKNDFNIAYERICKMHKACHHVEMREIRWLVS